MNTLLTWLTDEDAASAILGDLTELRRHHARTSPVRAELWFWRAFMGVAFFIGARRGTDVLRRWVDSGFGFAGGFHELRKASRGLWRSPWYSFTAIGVIALGMSLATTAFAVVDGVLFKPLPYASPGELYQIAGAFSKLPALSASGARVITLASVPDMEAWSAASGPATLAAYDLSIPSLPLGGDVRPRVAQVDARVLEVLGVTSFIGGFRAGDFTARSAVRPALITYSLWQGHFGGTSTIVGQLAGPPENRIEIVGVLPRGFVLPTPSRRAIPEVLTPLVVESASKTNVRSRWLQVIGRIPSGVPRADIGTRLTDAMQRVAASWPPVVLPPGANETMRITRGPADVASIRPIRDVMTSTSVGVSRIVFAAALFLVFLSGVTVAGLVASRLEGRRSELMLRRALGGSSSRIVRLIAAEGVVVVFTGAVLGAVAASPLLGITLALMPPGLMYLKPPVLDARVLVFGTLASILMVAVVTAWAARSTTSQRLSAEANARATFGRADRRGRAVLIGVQVAAAVAMAIGGALLSASLARVWREDPGFDPEHTGTIRLDEREGDTAASISQFVETLQGLPGVSAAAGLGGPFLENMYNGNGFEQPAVAKMDFLAEGIGITSGYFAAAGLHPIMGRLPSDEELDRGEPVLVVSELVARAYWPGAGAIGQRLKKDSDDRDFEVIGVVPDARYRSLDRDPDGAIYSSLAVEARPTLMNVMIRFDGDAAAGLASTADVITARFPMYRVRSAMTVMASLGESIRARRFQTWLFSAFGLAAVILTGAGILGVMAMTTARRTREVGIRMAIGATRSNVISQLLREQMLTVSAGLLAGAGIAVWAARFVRAFVYKVDIYDPAVWTVAILTILATAAVGTLVPAARASKIDPVKALRAD